MAADSKSPYNAATHEGQSADDVAAHAALTAAMQSALTAIMPAIYAITSDPLVAGTPWNHNGNLIFSAGPGVIDFSIESNSQYIPLIFQDF